jgi:L-asparagine oxygenase
MKENTLTLTDTEKIALQQEIERLNYDPAGGCDYISELRFIAMRTLPRRVLDTLAKQKTSLSPKPYFVIDNLPVDNWINKIPHPMKYSEGAKSGSVSENLLIAISSIVGEPYSISFEGGELVNNLIPTQNNKSDFTGVGSEVELDFHIENAALKCLEYYNFSPMGLLLTGVSLDVSGPLTRISDSREALKLLSNDQINLLRSPLYKIKVPYRWRHTMAGQSETGLVPVIREGKSFPDIAVAFYSDMVVGVTSAASLALKAFHTAVRAVSIAYVVKPGSLIYIDNRFALHSRDQFKPIFNSQGISSRWIQRVFVAANLWQHRDHIRIRNRVFNPINKEVSDVTCVG